MSRNVHSNLPKTRSTCIISSYAMTLTLYLYMYLYRTFILPNDVICGAGIPGMYVMCHLYMARGFLSYVWYFSLV